jgi:predicted metalloendopeptidase
MLALLAWVASAAAAAVPEPAAPAAAPAGLDLAGMDTTMRPGDDPFRFANGAWLRSSAIPEDRSRWGTFDELVQLNDQRTAGLISTLAAQRPPAGSDARKVADFHASYMDEAAIERRGLAPVRPALARIAAIRNRRDLARVLGASIRADVDALNATNLYTDNIMGLWVAQDLDQPGRYLPFLLQGGLGMPDRDYYLSGSEKMRGVRREYLQHIETLLRIAHQPDAAAAAGRVFSLETRIASVHASRSASEDVAAGNNHWRRADFERRAPGLEWQELLHAAHLDTQGEFVVWQPGAMTGIAALAGSASLEDWKAYLRYHAILHLAGFLPKAYVDEEFHFYGTVLAGTPQQRPRWQRGVERTNAALGEAVGRLYVERYFPPAAKAQISALVDALLQAFARRIDQLEWMAPATRQEARAKLAALRVGVGYPDQWRDYSGLRIARDDAYGNALRAELFDLQRSLARLGQGVDRGEWVMTPQTVNAVNLPALNALNFPAGILQPPFFDPRNPAAQNFGAIGAIIGHEISHSFDDQGAKFDAQGRFRDWWTAADLAQFRLAGRRLAAQYDAYRPFPDVAVNGTQTLSENIADVAGIATAFDAYQQSLAGAPAPEDHGYSGEQQFFIAYARNWREAVREPALRQQLVTDGHAPAEFRAAAVRNIDGWYRAFAVQPGQRLYLPPAERVPVW